MARNTKKSGGKRYNVPAETLERARAELRGEAGEIMPAATPSAPAAKGQAVTPPKVQPKRAGTFAKSTRVPTLEELRADYGYVWKEIRTLGLLGAGLFVVIIAAAVILPRLG